MIQLIVTKDQFQKLVETLGFEAAYKLIVGDKKNVHLSFNESGTLKTKKITRKKKQSKKVRKSERAKKRLQTIQKYANKLNEKLPRSEQWFQDLYKQHFICRGDLFNSSFQSKYIPDVINKEYKYIVEIDGNIHDQDFQIKRDFKKDQFYKKHGYDVFRVKAYDDQSYIELIKFLFIKRNKTSYPTSAFKEYLLTFDLDYVKIGLVS